VSARGVGVAVLAALAVVVRVAPAQDLLVRGGTVVTGTGEIIEGGSVLISGGKIAAVGRDLRASGKALVVEAEGRFICPGFIDAHSHLGLHPGELDETVLPISVETSPLGAFDPRCQAATAALALGVTTALLAPGYANLLSGPGAAVKLGRDSPLSRTASVSISVSTSALLPDRKPTSMPVLLEMVHLALAEAEQATDQSAPLSQAARGGLPVQVYCDGASSVEQALALVREFGLRGSVLVPDMPKSLPSLLAGTGVAALLPPLTRVPEDRYLAEPAKLVAAGVPIAFTSMAMGDQAPDVRTSAALAVSAGLAREDALRALTLGAAEILGISDHVGSLEKGKDGDLLVIGGHPLDLAAPVEYAVVDGAVVYERGAK